MADWISESVMSYTIVSSVPHGLSVTITWMQTRELMNDLSDWERRMANLHEEDIFVAVVAEHIVVDLCNDSISVLPAINTTHVETLSLGIREQTCRGSECCWR